MTRTPTLVAALVVLAALAGGVGHVGASTATAPTAASAQENCSFPATLTDSTGTNVTLEQAPEDVVVLGASNAQTIWEFGEQEHVVGMPVGSSTAYLNGSANRTHVLDETRVRIETVVDLEPDVVIAPGGGFVAQEDVQALRDAGVTVYIGNAGSSLQDVRDRVSTTGRLLGACDAADETVAWMDEQLAVVEEATRGVERPSTYYFLGGSFTAGSGTFQGDLMVRAGADNAAANMGIEGWDQAESEAIVSEDPEYVLVTDGATISSDHVLQETSALEADHVITVDTNYWNQAAPRIVLAVQNVTRQLHPDAYERANGSADEDGSDAGDTDGSDAGGTDGSDADGSADDSGSDGATGDGSGSGDAASDDDGGNGDGSPGFGVPVAVVALLGSLLALGRRE